MAHKKAGGSTKNLRDSNAQYLGVKLYDGEQARTGFIIVRQRGTKIVAGKNVGVGSDHTLFALSDGRVSYRQFGVSSPTLLPNPIDNNCRQKKAALSGAAFFMGSKKLCIPKFQWLTYR